MLKTISANSSNNPRSIILVGNYTYDALIFYNLTPITKQIAENTTNTRYTELSFGKYTRYLTVTSDQETHLTKPEGIVIHTDDQSGTGYFNWNSINTYYGLQERKTDAHFAVGRDGIGQFLKMYKDIVTPSNGASGFSNYIDIEMCGREYNDILNPSANADKKMVIEEITAKTIQLVIKLIDTYQINLNNVLGHYAASASGKTDPGKNYMENYFLPILRQTYWSTHKENVTVTPLVERTITPIRRRTVTPV